MGNLFFEITLILSLSALLSIFFKAIKQPPILAYILAGIIIGPFGRFQLQSVELLRVFGEFGIALLLFMVGLELRVKDFKNVGAISLIAGVFQITVTFFLSFFLSSFFGFSNIESFYLGTALTFSSTVIVLKLLSERRELNSLHGKISLGILLLQDLFALSVLIVLSGSSGTFRQPLDYFLIVLKGLSIFGLTLYLSKNFLPKITDFIATSSETLFLFSIAFALLMSALVKSIGFSIEIGAFLAGIALANSSESFQIQARTRALRDFFITIFFVILGISMTFGSVTNVLLLAIIFSLFVLILKPLIVMITLGVMGYKRRTSFATGIALSQISEFSLIIIFLGNRLHHISSDIVSLITIVAVVTFGTSIYIINGLDKVYKSFESHLRIFERKNLKDLSDKISKTQNHAVLIGANRMGRSILDVLKNKKLDVVVVDFNPHIVKSLREKGIKSIFGDIGDSDIQNAASLGSARLIISTIGNFNDNLFLTNLVKGKVPPQRDPAKAGTKIIIMANEPHEARKLYNAGADYVVLPHLAGGHQIAKLLSGSMDLDKLKLSDLKYLTDY